MTPALFFTGVIWFLSFELHSAEGAYEALEPPHILGTVLLICLSSLLAFGLNLAELWCISVTSALVMTLIGAFKTVLLVIVSALISGRHLSAQSLLGCGLASAGVVMFKLCRRATHNRQSPPSEFLEVTLTEQSSSNTTENRVERPPVEG